MSCLLSISVHTNGRTHNSAGSRSLSDEQNLNERERALVSRHAFLLPTYVSVHNQEVLMYLLCMHIAPLCLMSAYEHMNASGQGYSSD